MAVILGRIGRVAVSSDGGTTFFELGSILDASMSSNAEEIDVSTHSTGQFRTFLQGRKDATLDISALWDQSDAGQNVVKLAFFGGTEIQVRFRLDEGSGNDEFVSLGIITSFSPGSPNDEAATLDMTIRVNGPYTLTPQV